MQGGFPTGVRLSLLPEELTSDAGGVNDVLNDDDALVEEDVSGPVSSVSFPSCAADAAWAARGWLPASIKLTSLLDVPTGCAGVASDWLPAWSFCRPAALL